MTDKELFEKTRNYFNISNKSIVVEVFEKGNFNKVLTEIRGPKEPTPPPVPKAGGFFNRLAAAIPGTRGHRMRSAEARKQEAEAKSAEVKARQSESDLFNGAPAATKGKTIPGSTTTPGKGNPAANARAIRIQADQYNIDILTKSGTNFKKSADLKKKIDQAIANNVQPRKEKTPEEFRKAYSGAYGASSTTIDQSQNTTVSGGSTLNASGGIKSASSAGSTSTVTPKANNAAISGKRPVKKPVKKPVSTDRVVVSPAKKPGV